MQRTPFGFAVLFSTMLMFSSALGGPLSPEPTAAQAGMPPSRPAAAQGNYGGGFLEFLFGGGALISLALAARAG